MGSGIAQLAAQQGCHVIVYDVQADALTAGQSRVAADIEALVKRGKLTSEDGKAISSRLTWTVDLTAIREVDLVIEAIIEDAGIKADLFHRIETNVRDTAVIATNTSSLPISRLARGLERPERFVGMHFFNPPTVMKLVEVVAGAATGRQAVEDVTNIARAWGKTAIAVADVPGFIVNRVARPFYAEAFTAMTEGCPPELIDTLFRAAGFKMGPLELTDLIGQDVNFAVARSIYESYYGKTRFAPQLRQAALVDAGWLGRKTGRGVYQYPRAEAPQGPPNDAVPIVVSHAHQLAGRAILNDLTGAKTGSLFEYDGVVIGMTRGRTALSESRTAGKPVALLDWFDVQKGGGIGFSGSGDAALKFAAGVITGWARSPQPTADRPGLIVMRTLAQLANAAADAAFEGVADEWGIDAAMRFGANYPVGPFAWSDGFGRSRVLGVLEGIAAETGNSFYHPSLYLRQTA